MAKYKQWNVYLDTEVMEWLEDQVRLGKFKNLSDGIRQCIRKEMQK